MVPCSSSTSMDDQHTTSSTSFNSPDTLSFNTKNTPPPVSMLGEKLEEEGEDTSSVSELEVTRSSSITLNSTALSSSTSPPTPTTSMTQWPAPKTLLSTLDLLSPHSRSLVKSSSFTATSMEEGEGASIHSFSFLPPSIEISSPPPHQHSCIDTFDFPFPKLVSSSSRPSVPSLFQLSLQSILVHVPFHPPSWHATTYPWQLSQYLMYLLPSYTHFTTTLFNKFDTRSLEHMNLNNTKFDMAWMKSKASSFFFSSLISLDLSFSYIYPPMFSWVPQLTYLNLSGAYPMSSTLFLSLPHQLMYLKCIELNHCPWLTPDLLTQLQWKSLWLHLQWISLQCCFGNQQQGAWVVTFLKQVRPSLCIQL